MLSALCPFLSCGNGGRSRLSGRSRRTKTGREQREHSPTFPFTHLQPRDRSYLVPVVPDFTKICTDCKLKYKALRKKDCRSARRDTLPLGRRPLTVKGASETRRSTSRSRSRLRELAGAAAAALRTPCIVARRAARPRTPRPVAAHRRAVGGQRRGTVTRRQVGPGSVAILR